MVRIRLRRAMNRRVGERQYDRFLLTIPRWLVAELEWRGDIMLEASVRGSKLSLRPAESQELKVPPRRPLQSHLTTKKREVQTPVEVGRRDSVGNDDATPGEPPQTEQ